MHHLKTAVVGAGLVFAAQKVGSMSFWASVSPTLAQFAPYIVGGGGLLAAKKFGLV